MPHRPEGIFYQNYEGFTSVENFPINAALLGLLPEEGPDQTPQTCQIHHPKPLDYYCLKCHQVICADCFIFGEHQEHKLSKKKELKDLNGYLIAKLDRVYSANKMLRGLRDCETIQDFLNGQARTKLGKIRRRVERVFDVRKPGTPRTNWKESVMKVRRKIELFFDNYEKIINFKNEKIIQEHSEEFSINPKVDLARLEQTLNYIKLENESVNVETFKDLYTLIHQTNLEIR